MVRLGLSEYVNEFIGNGIRIGVKRASEFVAGDLHPIPRCLP